MIIKVCGMRDAVNIRLADQINIDWMGFIFYPRSPRFVSSVPNYLPEHCQRVGVFVNTSENEIEKQSTLFNLNYIQLHGNETPDFCLKIKEKTGKSVIKAFGIADATDFERTESYENCADYFLFDTACTQKGGSGQCFNHQLLTNYYGKTPFLLSGGLGPEHAAALAHINHPQFFGIDLNSRFETAPAIKSIGRLQQFLSELNQYQQNPS